MVTAETLEAAAAAVVEAVAVVDSQQHDPLPGTLQLGVVVATVTLVEHRADMGAHAAGAGVLRGRSLLPGHQ